MNPDHQNQLTRLRKIEGQIRGILRMVEDRRYCMDILAQTKAVRAALEKVDEGILATHAEHCLKNAAQAENPAELDAKIKELVALFSKRH